MAYLRPIHTPKCVTCGKTATETLIGNRNQRYADYCTPDAKKALANLEAREEREAEQFRRSHA